MTRFFVNSEQITGDAAYLEGADVAHCRVLRLQDGDSVTLCDGYKDYDCRIAAIAQNRAELEIFNIIPSLGELKRSIHLYCAFPKSDKAEHIIQKAAELGAKSVSFFPSTNCVSKYDAKTAAKKLERWRKIAKEAAQQSQRGIVPGVNVCDSFNSAVKAAVGSGTPLFCYEGECEKHISEFTNKAPDGDISIITGSEGGFTGDEVKYAGDQGCNIVTLGT
ncbi:MAG: 16S rRNA (uracil(1498)-N(3))-methyltransferase, partial [Oscillospiraceae bacterium]|nr:16S rRNA (uracil(1498)-N(3))-methyltransferase [Oscillospiraceae bacterium]